jgi:hypothetical protein
MLDLKRLYSFSTTFTFTHPVALSKDTISFLDNKLSELYDKNRYFVLIFENKVEKDSLTDILEQKILEPVGSNNGTPVTPFDTTGLLFLAILSRIK